MDTVRPEARFTKQQVLVLLVKLVKEQLIMPLYYNRETADSLLVLLI